MSAGYGITCPKCSAIPWAACRTVSGTNRSTDTHRVRIEAAWAKVNNDLLTGGSTETADKQPADPAQTDVQDDIHRMLDDLDSAAPLSDAPAQAGER